MKEIELTTFEITLKFTGNAKMKKWLEDEMEAQKKCAIAFGFHVKPPEDIVWILESYEQRKVMI